MDNFTVCLNAVLPMFFIIAAGYLSKRVGLMKDGDVSRFNSVSFWAFMPCLIFYNLYNTDPGNVMNVGLVAFGAGGLVFVFLAVTALVVIFEKDPRRRGVLIQGIFRSNYVVIGLPVASALLPASELGQFSLLLAFVIPIFNTLSVVALSIFSGSKISPGRIVRSIVTNPLILGAAAGLLARFSGLRVPAPFLTAVKDLGSAATPVQLFSLGAFFHFSGLGQRKKPLFWGVLGRLVLVPAVMLPIAAALGFRGGEFVALMVCFGSSNAVSSFAMSQQAGADHELAGDIVVVTSALCPLTVFCWAFLTKSLGLF